MNPRYRPDIDGLRALAILPVIIFHANLGCPGGFVGVDIFFVISGFLITTLIMKEIKDDSFSLAMFWERRIRRILPALLVVVLATVAAGWFLYLPQDFDLIGRSLVALAILMSNVFFWKHTGYFSAGLDTKPLVHTWSLAVEEQFYVLFPLLLIFLARRKRFATSGTILCLIVVSFALSVAGCYYSPDATFYLLPTRAWELMIGAWVAAMPERPLSRMWMNQAAALCGLALILYAVFYYTRETRFPGAAAIPPCLGAALIIFSGSGRLTLVGRALALPPFVFIGLISYSLYLWHWPLLAFADYSVVKNLSWKPRLALLVVSAALAVVSWKWIETPFRKRSLCPRRPQVFALFGCSVLALLMIGFGVYLGHGIPSRLPAKVLKVASYRNDFALRYDTTPQEAAAGHFPELGAQSASQPIEILLWGDSHAMAVAPALDELCRKYSVRGVEATHTSTAPLLGYNSHYNSGGLHEKSIAFGQSVIEFIAQKHIKTVFLAAQWRKYRPVDLVEARLAATVQAIIASGASVYIIKDFPVPDFDVPRATALAVLHHGDMARLATPLYKYAADNDDYQLIFDHVSKLGATVLDTPKFLLNTSGSYDVIRDDKPLYWDTSHLSVVGARLLLPMFEPLFHAK